MPVRGHSWDYWDAKLTSQVYDKETSGSIIGKWEQEESKEADARSNARNNQLRKKHNRVWDSWNGCWEETI